MADADNEPAVGAVSQLVPATLKAMHALEFAGRHISPTTLPQIVEETREVGRFGQIAGTAAGSPAHLIENRVAPIHLFPDQPRIAGPRLVGARGDERSLELV